MGLDVASRRIRAGRDPLDALFNPRSIAVVGATETAGSVGRAVMENLAVFQGPVIPVNPKYDTVLNLRAVPCVARAPERPDLAVIATPAATVPGIIQECVEAGIKAAVVMSAGFKETGPAGLALEQRVLEAARSGSLRLLGPNCLGLMAPRLSLNATFAAGIARPGRVAFLSQSGALCTAILDWSLRENVGFSAMVSMGSMTDIGWGDLITRFGDDRETESIVCYMESVGDARAFLSAAREVALTKPILCLKVGRTGAAARAAASHTGALTGSDRVIDAAFHRAGVLRVNTLGELFDMAEVLAKQPRPRGPRLAVVTNAGGPGALATDALVSLGGSLAQLGRASVDALEGFLPPHWSHGNPVDILGDASASRYADAIEIAAADPGVDGVLAILTPQSMADAIGTASRLPRCDLALGKPLLASWMGGAAVEAARSKLNAANIPTFDTPDAAARAFALMWRYSDGLKSLYETPAAGPADSGAEAGRLRAGALIASVRSSGRTLLNEAEAKQVLRDYGLPAIETRMATDEDQAVSHAIQLGFPVVLKLLSETITHKSDVGGVRLNLQTADEVRRAWQAIHKGVVESSGAEHFSGVTVQPMVTAGGCELIFGSSVDPQFGPVVVFGAGGRLVEIYRDSAPGLPPLNATLALRVMEQTRIFAALRGVRGEKAVNLQALTQALVRFSQLVVEQPRIAEIDVNPLIASADCIVAVDARIVLHPPDLADDRLPRLAIQPYPHRWVTGAALSDGTRVSFRPIRPEDEPLVARFHAGLSDRTVYLRYFTGLKLDERVAHERLSRVCCIDYDREMAIIAEGSKAENGETEIMGIARLSRWHGTNEGELALVVTDRWQLRGLGTMLLARLVEIARASRMTNLSAVMLTDNRGMQRLAQKAGFNLRITGGEVLAELRL